MLFQVDKNLLIGTVNLFKYLSLLLAIFKPNQTCFPEINSSYEKNLYF